MQTTVFMTCRTRDDKDLCFPSFYLAGQEMPLCSKYKYLGNIISEQMMMMTCPDSVAPKSTCFYFCSYGVKISLFRTCCTLLYTAPLWVKLKKASMPKLQVSYNDCMRILFKQPRWCSASVLFCRSGVSTFHALLS